MRKELLIVLALALAACGNEPPPKPAPKASAPVPQKAAPAPQAAPAPAPKAVEAPPDPNALLAGRVRRALEDGHLQAAGIDVTASSGAVSLFGTVPTAAEKSRAARIAGKVDGVKSVDNRIVVVRGS